GSQALGEFHDRWIERYTQLLAQQPLVHPRGLERPGPVARGREGVHQAERHAGVERIERREPAPPRGRGRVLAGLGGLGREPLERRRGVLPQPASLRLHPAFELRRIAQIEAVEKRAPVELGSLRRVTALERGLEGLHIAGDDVRIEPQLSRAEEEIGLAQVAPQRVAGLLEEATSVLGVCLGPQIGDELVAAEAGAARSSEEREQRQGLALLGGPVDRGVVYGGREAAECLEVQHARTFHPFDPPLTGVSPTRAKLATSARNGEAAQEDRAQVRSTAGKGGLYDVGTLLHTLSAAAYCARLWLCPTHSSR